MTQFRKIISSQYLQLNYLLKNYSFQWCNGSRTNKSIHSCLNFNLNGFNFNEIYNISKFNQLTFQNRTIFKKIFNSFNTPSFDQKIGDNLKNKQEVKENINSFQPTQQGSNKSCSSHGSHSLSSSSETIKSLRQNPNGTISLPNIKKIIAVASGKGGVGKSTVSTNLALAIAHKHEKRVGILDADVYGPSIHKMFNLKDNSVQINENSGKLLPATNFGVQIMSMGILTKSDEAAIWRGPMVMGALRQMLTQVEWGELDYLVIDLPPGTGDAQLTLTQQLRLDGAVIVSTPQDIALIDVVRGINMFKVVQVPIIGIVENMSYFQCSDCQKLGKKRYIFGKSGAKLKAEEMGISFLGEIPIEEIIPISCDEGKPLVIANRDSISSKQFFELSDRVIETLSEESHVKNKPTIVFEE